MQATSHHVHPIKDWLLTLSDGLGGRIVVLNFGLSDHLLEVDRSSSRRGRIINGASDPWHHVCAGFHLCLPVQCDHRFKILIATRQPIKACYRGSRLKS